MLHIGPYFGCGTRQTSARGDVAECSVSQIAIEDVASDARDKEVRKSIVVEIRRRGAHHVAVSLHAGVLGHVREAAVAEISIQTVPVVRPRAAK